MWTLELVELCGRWMRTAHVRNFQVQQVATTKLRQVKWSKERDGFEFDVRVFGGHQFLMTGEKTSVHKPLLSAGWRRDRQKDTHFGWTETLATSSRKTHRF